MDSTLISYWNSVISNQDIVYHLGDFAMGDVNHYGSKLNGRIILITGNHDKKSLNVLKNSKLISPFYETHKYLEINVNGYDITLCHYAMRTWNKSHYNSWHLYGHSHNMLPPQGKSFDVGVDGNNFFPWSFEQIKEKMNSLPNNINYIGDKNAT